MTTEQIEILFYETINKKEAYGKALYNLLDGVTENQIYNWRKQRTKPTIGDMLNVLYQLKLIKVIGIVEIPYEEILNSIKENPFK